MELTGRPGGLVGRAAVLVPAILVGMLGQPPAARAGDGPTVGEPCSSVHTHPVRVVPGASGGLEAVFSMAGGSFQGHVPLSAADAEGLSTRHDVHVTDVQLGSYEPVRPGSATSAVACRIDPTFHLYCQVTDVLDELCIEWTDAWPVLSPSQPGSIDQSPQRPSHSLDPRIPAQSRPPTPSAATQASTSRS